MAQLSMLTKHSFRWFMSWWTWNRQTGFRKLPLLSSLWIAWDLIWPDSLHSSSTLAACLASWSGTPPVNQNFPLFTISCYNESSHWCLLMIQSLQHKLSRSRMLTKTAIPHCSKKETWFTFQQRISLSQRDLCKSLSHATLVPIASFKISGIKATSSTSQWTQMTRSSQCISHITFMCSLTQWQ